MLDQSRVVCERAMWLRQNQLEHLVINKHSVWGLRIDEFKGLEVDILPNYVQFHTKTRAVRWCGSKSTHI